MRVTKEMVHPDLRPRYGALNTMAWLMKRSWFRLFSQWVTNKSLDGKDIAGLSCNQVQVPSSDGRWQIRTRIYRPAEASEALPAMIYIHGAFLLRSSISF